MQCRVQMLLRFPFFGFVGNLQTEVAEPDILLSCLQDLYGRGETDFCEEYRDKAGLLVTIEEPYILKGLSTPYGDTNTATSGGTSSAGTQIAVVIGNPALAPQVGLLAKVHQYAWFVAVIEADSVLCTG